MIKQRNEGNGMSGLNQNGHSFAIIPLLGSSGGITALNLLAG